METFRRNFGGGSEKKEIRKRLRAIAARTEELRSKKIQTRIHKDDDELESLRSERERLERELK